MPKIRVGFSSDFVIENSEVGIGTTNPTSKLHVVGTAKADFNITGVSTLRSYSGFIAQKQHINKESSIGFATVGVGTFEQYYETETGFVDLGGVQHGDDLYYNTLSEDLIVDDGQILNISSIDMVGVTPIGEYDPHSHQSHVCAGALESVSVQSNFSVPCGGIETRPENPIEGTVRFNDDLNTLEFYNGVEWRQFTVTGASGRAVYAGGYYSSPSIYPNTIEYVNINTLGNSKSFGDLTGRISTCQACGSETRGLYAGNDGTPTSPIEYITLASQGNSIDFGNLSALAQQPAGSCSSSTRGIWGGRSPSPGASSNVIDYVEINTLGNALDFGDLKDPSWGTAAVSSPVRGVFVSGSTPSPGYTGELTFITIASKGNSVRFGELSVRRRVPARGSNSSGRAVFGGGQTPAKRNTIDYITISTEGTAIYFGDLSDTAASAASCGVSGRMIRFGGNTPTIVNTIDYVIISTMGNSVDFGDMSVGLSQPDATSDSHGGLGGF